MDVRMLAVLGVTTTQFVAASPSGTRDGDQSPNPLETVMGYYLEGPAAWRRDNPDYVAGGEDPRFWIREYRRGPGHDVLLADAYAVFDGDRCEPMVHFVHVWDGAEERVANQNFGANGLYFQGTSWRESPAALVTEVEGRLPDGSSIRFRDVSDLSNPNQSVSVGHRWDGERWMVLDTLRWDRAPARACG